MQDNSSPIACLPPEILLVIFLQAVRDSLPSPVVYMQASAKCPMALSISRVSQLWREIALSTSELWTWIDALDLGIIRTFMDRAKDRPLSVILNKVKPENETTVRTALKSLDKIQSLEVSVYYETDVEMDRAGPFPEMAEPAPLLESLSLDGIHLPESPFSGSLPALQHLSIGHHNRELRDIPECPRLRSLCIDEPEEYILLSGFLERLPTFPLLERLETSFVFEDNSGTNVLPGRIELPRLKYLLFNPEGTTNVVAMLNHILIPSTCKVMLHVNQEGPDEYLSLFPALAGCRVGTPKHIREIRVDVNAWFSIGIYEGPSKVAKIGTNTTDLRSNIEYTIWFPSDHRPHYPITIVTGICQNILDLTHVETIDLTGYNVDDYPTTAFWEFLESLSTLRVLKVRHIYAKSFAELVSTPPQPPDIERTEIPFSKIHKLVYEDPSKKFNEYASRIDHLFQYLKTRAEMQLRLTDLTLVQVGRDSDPIPESLLKGLGQFVVDRIKRKTRRWQRDSAKLVEH